MLSLIPSTLKRVPLVHCICGLFFSGCPGFRVNRVARPDAGMKAQAIEGSSGGKLLALQLSG